MNIRNIRLFAVISAIVVITLCSTINACPTPAPDPCGSGGGQIGGVQPESPVDGDPIDLINGVYFSSATDLVVKGRLRDIVIKRHYTSTDTSKVRMDASDFFSQTQVHVYQVDWTAPTGAQNVTSLDGGKVMECTFNVSGSYQFSLLVRYYYGSSPYTYAQQTYVYTVDYSTKATPIFLGNHWDFNYDVRLDEISSDKILLFNGEHTSYLFIRKPNTNNPVEYSPPTNATDFVSLVKNQNDSTYTLTKKQNEIWSFNSSGQITAMTDRNGNNISFGYADNKLTTITDDLGRDTILSYNGTTGLLETVTDESGRQVAYTYEADNDLSMVTRPETSEPEYDDLTTAYTYDSSHQLLTVADPYSDVWLSNTYNNGKVTAQQYGDNGQHYSIIYNTANNKTIFTDRRGYHTVYTYSNSNQTILKQTYDGAVGSSTCCTTTYAYNADGTIGEIILPKGNDIRYLYDSYRNVSSIQKCEGTNVLMYSMTYDDKGFIQTYTTPQEYRWLILFTYDYEDSSYGTDVGNLMKITLHPVNDENGSLVTPEINFAYNNYGQITEVELQDGTVVRYNYGDSGNNNGRVTSIIYDYGEGDALNIEYQFTYDSYGNIDTVVKPDDTTIDLDYNALFQLTQIKNELDYTTKYHYTKNGELDKVRRQIGSSYSDSTAQTWEYGYDILDKLQTVTNPLGYITEIGRDDSDNVTSVKDPEGRDASPQYLTGYTYNARNLGTRITDAEDGHINYSYDQNGNLLTATDNNGKVTTYYCDFADRLWKISYHDSSYEQFTYDNSSNITQERKRDGTIIYYRYDALNRQTSKQIGSGTITYYKYDIIGRLRYVVEGTTTVASYAYDRIGRLTSTTDSSSKTVGYEYNDNGQRTKLTYPDGSYITYEYDSAGRLRYIKDDSGTPITLATFDNDTLSRITKVTFATINSAYEEFDFEDAGSGDDDKGVNVKQVSYSLSSLNAYDYTYDKVGNATNKSYSSLYYDFTYDRTYQLTIADYPGGSSDDWVFNYDRVYNRTSTVNNGSTRNYALKTNGLNQYDTLSNPSASLSYDNKGNLTNDGTNKYVFNIENYMTALKNQSDVTLATYTYDWAGRRISKTYNFVITTYVYDGDDLIAEYEGTTLKRKYVYGPGIDFPVMMIAVDGETETKYYYFHDALGSVVALLNNSGSVVEGYTYDSFGKPTVHTAVGNDGKWLTADDTKITTNPESQVHNCWMFTARQWDAESGLYYYRARMYQPTIGRFLQPDPLRYYDSMNLYQYCRNNPMSFTDPYGLIAIQFRKGNYCGPDYSGGHKFPYTNSHGDRYKRVEDVPDDEWKQMMHDNPPVNTRDKAYCEHDNAYRDAANEYGRGTEGFKKATRAADRKLAEDLWNTGRTKDPVDDLFNGLFTIGFKVK